MGKKERMVRPALGRDRASEEPTQILGSVLEAHTKRDLRLDHSHLSFTVLAGLVSQAGGNTSQPLGRRQDVCLSDGFGSVWLA